MNFTKSVFISLLFSICFIAAKSQYTYTQNNEAKVCFKKFCETDTISLASIKKVKQLDVLTDDESLKIIEFTFTLIDVNDQVYVGKSKSNNLDRNNIDLMARSYKTIELHEIIAKTKDGRMYKLKNRLYWIKP
jgi:hypothetical protein